MRPNDIYDYDYDLYGYPGEFVYGDYMYIPDYYMGELWKRDRDFEDYWVSDMGRVWSDISKSFIEGSPVGRLGHIDMSLKRGGIRYHKYLHRMVAEAFIPNPHQFPIVRHLDDNPSNNCANNLAWGTPKDNVQDAIRSGRFRYFSDESREKAMEKRRTPVKAIHIRSGREHVFRSQQEASRSLGIEQSCISGVLLGKSTNAGGYYFCDPSDEKTMDFSNYRYSRHYAPIRAINIHTGEGFIFKGQTEAAEALGMSIASVSMVLSGKQASTKGYIFEYIDEED